MEQQEQQRDRELIHELPGGIADWLSLWRNVHRPEPRGIFHYTDAAGLHGIVNSGCLWATHIYYLNDSREFKYARQLIVTVLQAQIDNHPGPIVERLDQLRKCAQAHFALLESIADPYVVCFCESGNLLSQWRAYAADGNGFALEFEPAGLMTALRKDPELASNVKLLRVVYDESQQRQFIESAIEQLLKAFDTHGEQEVLNCVPRVFSEMSLCFKHHAFGEEQEWRLVFMPRGAERFVEVRVSRGRLLPYASMPFCNRDEQPPYVSVVHGPTLEAENTQKAIQMLIGKANRYWDRVNVSGSDAPLRSR
jgi:hypothetical protein